jgi:hypothetical protein
MNWLVTEKIEFAERSDQSSGLYMEDVYHWEGQSGTLHCNWLVIVMGYNNKLYVYMEREWR